MWVMRDAARATARGTTRHKKLLMSVHVYANARTPTARELDLVRLVNKIARTCSPAKRFAGQFEQGHEANVRNIYDDDSALIQCYGAHVLCYSHATPSESTWITWDFADISAQQLDELLNFDLHPDTLRTFETDTMHKPRMNALALFEVPDERGRIPLDNEMKGGK